MGHNKRRGFPMPFVLQLLPALKQAGWKVKIHDSERLEPPHVTVYCKLRKWRLSLRDGTFLDQGAKWSQIHAEVREAIEAEWETLRDAWDRLFPDNPVRSEEEEDNNG